MKIDQIFRWQVSQWKWSTKNSQMSHSDYSTSSIGLKSIIFEHKEVSVQERAHQFVLAKTVMACKENYNT